MLGKLFGKTMPAVKPARFDPAVFQYKAKKTWPPDLTKMSRNRQLRMEKTFKRRVNLKYTRPTWNKWVKIAQFSTVSFATLYMVLFMDWKQPEVGPFESVRKFVFGLVTPFSEIPDSRFKQEAAADRQSPTKDTRN